ncbi:hypothetical protein [Paenibacillus pseudetheri]|nr:hypothetical protein [Paenibacillus pseudetheri]
MIEYRSRLVQGLISEGHSVFLKYKIYMLRNYEYPYIFTRTVIVCKGR